MGRLKMSKPPLAKAAREFLIGIQLPVAKRGPNRNKDFALVLNAMFWHASGIEDDSEIVTCSPSLEQIAELAHCSARDVQRALSGLISLGIVERKRRGDGLSSIYTVRKKPKSDTTTVVHSENAFRYDNSIFRSDNLGVQTRQFGDQTRQQLSTSGVDLQDSKESSGVNLQGASAPQSQPQNPTPPFSLREDQSLKPKLRNDLFITSMVFELKEKFPNTDASLPAYTYTHALYDAIESVVRRQRVKAWEAKMAIQDKAAADQANGTVIDKAYFEEMLNSSEVGEHAGN
jgi:hypothetical protein